MPESRFVSVIIPVWRDEHALAASLAALQQTPGIQIIVATVLGEEPRYRRIRERYPGVCWVSAPRGRAVQMKTSTSCGA